MRECMFHCVNEKQREEYKAWGERERGRERLKR